jgi:hypothetical protein
MGDTNPPVTPAWKEVRRSLDKRNINIPISGPDWTDLPVFDASKIDFDEFIGAYDIHSYQGIDDEKQKIVEDWARWAKQHNKPLFLSEIGDMRKGWKDDNPGPKSFAAALSNAESVLRGLSAGVSAFNRWSFTNRGDLDGQWQLVRTWDIANKKYYDKIEPEPVAYYGYGIITRFLVKHSSVVQTDPIGIREILSNTLVSDDGNLTTYILNKSDSTRSVNIRISGSGNRKLYLYRVTEEESGKSGFRMDPVKEINHKEGKIITIDLLPKSINTLTTFRKMQEEPARK